MCLYIRLMWTFSDSNLCHESGPYVPDDVDLRLYVADVHDLILEATSCLLRESQETDASFRLLGCHSIRKNTSCLENLNVS